MSSALLDADLAVLAVDRLVRERVDIVGIEEVQDLTAYYLTSLAGRSASEILDVLWDRASRADTLDCGALWRNPSLSPAVLRAGAAAATELDVRTLELVAGNPSLPPDLMEQLAQHHVASVRHAVATNASASPAVLVDLAGDPEQEVRWGVAENPSTPVEVLRTLASRRRDVGLQARVARNPSAPPDLLRKLASRSRPQVREGVAANPSAPHDLRRALANTDEALVLHALAVNEASPPDVLDDLRRRSTGIARRVAENPSSPAKLLDRMADDAGMVDAVVRNPSVAEATLRRLSRHERARVREAVASCARCPLDVASDLMEDADGRVRSAVLRNAVLRDPATTVPASSWERVLDGADIHDVYRVAAARHADPAFPGAVLGAWRLLEDVAVACREGLALPKAKRARRWSSLPSQLDLLIDLPVDAAAVEARSLAGLRGRVARTGREIERLHERMGNCLDSYIPRARRGEVIVASYDDPARNETYAVVWQQQDDGTWMFQQADSKYNRGALPSGFVEDVPQVTDAINASRRDLPSLRQAPAVDAAGVRGARTTRRSVTGPDGAPSAAGAAPRPAGRAAPGPQAPSPLGPKPPRNAAGRPVRGRGSEPVVPARSKLLGPPRSSGPEEPNGAGGRQPRCQTRT